MGEISCSAFNFEPFNEVQGKERGLVEISSGFADF
jgi:hypothetical protein